MVAKINADTSGGLKITSDTSGTLEIQSAGTTKFTVNSAGVDIPAIGTINGLTSINGGQIGGSRNKIINGAMVIDQRNAGASVTPASTPTYTIDRWNFQYIENSKFSTQRSTTVPSGFTNSMLVTSLSAYSVGSGDIFLVQQSIEGFNIADLAWGTASAATVTLSLWVRSSLTGTFGGALLNGAQNRSYPFTYAISSANTWEKKSITIAGDTTGTWATDNSSGIRVTFGLGGGATYSGTAGEWVAAAKYTATGAVSVVGTSSATFYITGVQLEKGSTATEFEQRGIGTELALCQRYYAKTFPMSTAPANGIGSYDGVFYSETPSGIMPVAMWQFPVNMRAAPTITTFNMRAGGTSGQWTNASTDLANVRVVQATERQGRIDNGGVAASGGWHINVVASAEL
jgi:hypothetical protein